MAYPCFGPLVAVLCREPSKASSSLISLMATNSPVLQSLARKTSPHPPLPSLLSTSYWPHCPARMIVPIIFLTVATIAPSAVHRSDHFSFWPVNPAEQCRRWHLDRWLR